MKKTIEKNTRALLPQEACKNLLELTDAAQLSSLTDGDTDAVLCLHLLQQNTDGALLREIHRVLKNEGYLVACLKPYAAFRTQLKALFDVNAYYTKGAYAWFQAQKREDFS